MKKRHGPTDTKARKTQIRTLCAIGTLAHNRRFRLRDAQDYLRFENHDAKHVASAIRRFKSMGWLEVEKGEIYPTARGWRAVEKACRRTA